MSYIPPEIPLEVGKKKTKKAFVPGYAGRAPDSEDRSSSYRYAKSTDETDVVTPIEPCAETAVGVPVVPDDVESSVAAVCDAVLSTERPSDECDRHEEREQESSPESVTPAPSACITVLESIAHLTRELACMQEEKRVVASELKALLTEEAELCEAERFDEAEIIESRIQGLADRLALLDSQICRSQPAAIRAARRRLEQLRADALAQRQAELASVVSESDCMRARFESQLDELQTRLAAVRKVDEMFAVEDAAVRERREALAVAKAALEEEIATESGEAAGEKARAEAEAAALDLRIAELQRELAEAMAQRSECAMVVSANELRLSTVRKVHFANELEELADRQRELEEEEARLADKKASSGGGDLNAIQDEISDLVKLRSEAEAVCVSRVDLLRREVDELSLISEMESRWSLERERAESLVLPLREKLLAAYEMSQLVTEAARAAEAEMAGLKARVTRLKLRVPELEAEKREAIAARSFKEAKDLASELKEASDELDASEERLGRLRAAAKAARAEVALANATVSARREELAVAEAEWAGALECLRERIQTELAEIPEGLEVDVT